MIARAAKPCRRCKRTPTRNKGGVCDGCGGKRDSEAGRDPVRRAAARRIYDSARWRGKRSGEGGLRRVVLARDPFCSDPFGIGCQEPSEEVDHIEPLHERPADAFQAANLQGLCGTCHKRKTGRGK